MKHVEEMMKGTPLLLRMMGDGPGAEKMKIYVFQVDSTGQFLQWSEADGSPAGKVPISSIVDVAEESSNESEDMGGMIRVTSVENQGFEQQMDLIFASPEDVVTWRDGLRFMVDAARTPNASSPKASALASKRPRTAGGNSGPGTSTAQGTSMGQLAERIQLQDELILELRQENSVLNQIAKQKDEIVKQKDLAIAALMQEVKNRGTKSDHSSKTESTSRESDNHLRDREMAIIKGKNSKLKKMVEKKQRTITNLMQTLQSALGGQTSDADMLQTEDDDDDEADSDEDLGTSAAAMAAQAALAPGCLADSSSESEGGQLQAPQAAAPQQLSSPQQLAAKKARERAELAAAATRAGFGQATASPSAVAAQKKGAGFDFSAVGGVASMARCSMSKNSKVALDILSKEMGCLEEKKRAVEQLAKQLEPPSDDDEDDAFPLQ